MDLAEPDRLDDKIARVLAHHDPLRRGLGLPEVDPRALREELLSVAPRILPFMDAVWELLEDNRRAGKRILFEGAQGVLLDVDHGTYPYVTSSNTVAASAASGSGLGPGAIGYVLGIAKAYTTRVGGGPFPTELHDAIGELIGDRGREFGTNTGRRRRCGWFDAVLTRQAVKTSGIDGVALTKLDILDGFDEIKICTHYTLDEKRIDRLPASQAAQARVQPVYESFPGLEGIDERRALLGASAGAGDQICSPHRGADRGAGRAALDQSRTRRHDPRAQSVSGLSIPPLASGPATARSPLRKSASFLDVARRNR